MRIFAYLGAKEANRIVMKFCIVVGVPDVITHANLDDDRFRVFEGAGVEFPTFPLTCVVIRKTLWQRVIHRHQCADNTHRYISASIDDTAAKVDRLKRCTVLMCMRAFRRNLM